PGVPGLLRTDSGRAARASGTPETPGLSRQVVRAAALDGRHTARHHQIPTEAAAAVSGVSGALVDCLDDRVRGDRAEYLLQAARAAGRGARAESHADVFVPQLRPCLNEVRHQTDARRILKHRQRHSPGTQQLFLAEKRAVLADHDGPYAV